MSKRLYFDTLPPNLLTKIKTVDGASSGLDADLLDGQQGAYYATAASVSNLTTVYTDTLEPSGFLNPETVDIAYNSTNRTITLTGTLVYYWRGTRYTLASPWTSSAHDSGDGRFFLYSTNGTDFTWSTNSWSLDALQVAVAIVQDSGSTKLALRELHGTMPHETHAVLHFTIGTFRKSGGGLTSNTYTVNTASDAATTPGFDEAVIIDEDLESTISVVSQGSYTTLRIGAGAVSVFDISATFPFRSSGSFILINNVTSGAETAAATNRYLNVYQLLMPVCSDVDSQKYRCLLLQPQNSYTSLSAAQGEDPRSLVLGTLALLSPEFCFYSRITFITNSSDSNTGKCRIATNGISYITGSKANQISVTSFTTTQAQNVTLVPVGSVASTNVQDAFEEMDAEKQAVLVSGTSIKTINSNSLLGSGNLTVQDVLVSGTSIKTINSTTLLGSGNLAVQDVLVSGTSIKTINNNSLLGSGDLTISSGNAVGSILYLAQNCGAFI